MPKLSIIIPCYFNELNIPTTSQALLLNEKLFPNDVSFEYVMVDDGSKDRTFEALSLFKNQYPEKVTIVKLSGNFGSYNAIQAGMEYATGDCNIVITADLQDPPELMPKMYEYWLKGFKLVLANREERDDPFLTKILASGYQKLIKKFALPNIPDGGFDFCLFDRQLREDVLAIQEKNTNSLYLLVWLKYEYACIPYKRREREIGKSRWTMKKKIQLFIDSFVSFSYAPLRFITISGILLGSVSFIYALYVLYAKLSGHVDVEGWTTMMMVFLLVSSFQMLAIGIIGEYLWRNFEATRNRPAYVIDKVL
ncbi:MAG: glycosyltransferase family 2 protein [Bacteroidota bacterium]